MEEITRPTYMEVNLDNFNYNIQQIREKLHYGVNIMPVIKANGYGTFINSRLDIINQFDIVAVATVDEGIFLRKIGYQKEIFVLNQPYSSEIEKIIKYDITVGISSIDFANLLGQTNCKINVHIEIGTGMGRTGIHPFKVEEYLKNLPSNLFVEGIYTHLSSADDDFEYTQNQLRSFNTAVECAKNILGNIKYIHTSASNAILNFPEAHFNLVRPGIIMYGYPACSTTLSKIDLKPVAQLKSTVTFLKSVKSGTSIGYNRSFITSKSSKIATIPLGYADGFRRTFSNNFHVLIRGHLAPIVGKVCMDSFMADVSKIDNVSIGDEVVIWDNTNILLDDLAKTCDTINYEILSTISARVPRKFISSL